MTTGSLAVSKHMLHSKEGFEEESGSCCLRSVGLSERWEELRFVEEGQRRCIVGASKWGARRKVC